MAFDFPTASSGTQVQNSGVTYRFDGVKWVAVSSAGGGGASITVGDTPPASPTPGALWWDSVSGNLFLWYADPNSQEWVIANTGGISDATNDGNIYARQSQAWTNITTVVAGGPNNVGRSLVHNGLFTVQQRGTGPFTAAAPTADRWGIDISTSTVTVNIVALADADRTAIADEAAQFALSALVGGTAGANDYAAVYQNIEGVRRLSGKTVTVSFWARANSGTPRLGIGFYQQFGSGGSPSPVVTVAGQSVTLSTTWTRYSLSFSLPSTAGMTLGTTVGTDKTSLYFWYSAGSANAGSSGSVGVQSNTFIVWGVQLEVGNVATPLEHIDPQIQLANCRRFYQILSYRVPAAANATTLIYSPPMRAAPTLAGGAAGFASSGTSANSATVSQTTAAVQSLTASADL